MELTLEQMKARILELESSLQGTKRTPKITAITVSAKGGVSVYGLGRFPVTLYGEQWALLLAKAPEITAFIAANSAKLSTKKAIVAQSATAATA